MKLYYCLQINDNYEIEVMNIIIKNELSVETP